jgi:stearoyl-CoA desaturase (delta-9 desaturase)
MNEQTVKPKLNITNLLFFTLTPIIGIAGSLYVWLHHSFHWATLGLAVFLVFATGMSITAGYHRLFSHITYKAHWTIRLLFVLFGSAAFEGSVLEWCADHRDHHRYTDQEKDPHNIKKGFWYAHIGWILYLDPNHYDFKNVEELAQDPILVWQHKYYTWIASITCFVVPALIAACWGDLLGGLFIAGALRLTLNHHFTFFINSVCHYFGKKTYSDISARDNWFVSLFTYGEGFHNFHHQFATDYRNGVRFFHFDPSKWLIWSLSKLGLASNLKRVDQEFIIKYRLQMESETLIVRAGVCPTRLDELLTPIREKLQQIHALIIKLRKEKPNYQLRLKEYKQQMVTYQKEFALTLKKWGQAKKFLLRKSVV